MCTYLPYTVYSLKDMDFFFIKNNIYNELYVFA